MNLHANYLEIQLGSDSHEKIHIQVVVMGDKRLGCRTSSDHVHHGRFHLQEAHVVEELADIGNDLRADVELFAHVRVDDQIQVALPESSFLRAKQ